jgi:hypothetical protein
MIIILRGHLRNSFTDRGLYDLIKALANIYSISIYIHTWNIVQSNVSWRQIDQINDEVTEFTIRDYFGDQNHLIKKIIIDDDTKIELIGNTNGSVCRSWTPLIGWKRMWYGKYNIVKSIPENERNDMIVNMRFDILNNSNSLPHHVVYWFIRTNVRTDYSKNIFRERVEYGVDNIYIGNYYTMHKLAEHFHYDLDSISIRYPYCERNELLVKWVNDDYV